VLSLCFRQGSRGQVDLDDTHCVVLVQCSDVSDKGRATVVEAFREMRLAAANKLRRLTAGADADDEEEDGTVATFPPSTVFAVVDGSDAAFSPLCEYQSASAFRVLGVGRAGTMAVQLSTETESAASIAKAVATFVHQMVKDGGPNTEHAHKHKRAHTHTHTRTHTHRHTHTYTHAHTHTHTHIHTHTSTCRGGWLGGAVLPHCAQLLQGRGRRRPFYLLLV
jgi:hypothetical protein